MAGARLNFIENRVLPLCRRLEAEDDVTVKSIDPTADGWFDVEDHPVVAAARRERLAAARTGFDMGVPFNELNRVFDLGFKPFSWSTRATSPRPCDQRTVGHLSSEPSLAFQELKLVWSVLHSELGSHLSGKQAIGEQSPIYWK